MFSCEFRKTFKITFLTEYIWMAASYVYLWILRSFLGYLFIEHLSGRLLISCAGCRISASIYNNYFTGTFQGFCIKARSSHWKVCSFNQNPWKLSVKKLISSNVARCHTKKLFHAYSFIYLAFIFAERITITSSKEALKLREHSFFHEI